MMVAYGVNSVDIYFLVWFLVLLGAASYVVFGTCGGWGACYLQVWWCLLWFWLCCVFNWRVSAVCLGTLLVLVLLFGCLLCLLVYLVFVACASLAVLLVGDTVVLGLGGFLVLLGVIATLCLSCFGALSLVTCVVWLVWIC